MHLLSLSTHQLGGQLRCRQVVSRRNAVSLPQCVKFEHGSSSKTPNFAARATAAWVWMTNLATVSLGWREAGFAGHDARILACAFTMSVTLSPWPESSARLLAGVATRPVPNGGSKGPGRSDGPKRLKISVLGL